MISATKNFPQSIYFMYDTTSRWNVTVLPCELNGTASYTSHMPILSIAYLLALSHHRGRLAIQRSPFIYLLRKGNSNGMDQRSLFQIHVYQTTPPGISWIWSRAVWRLGFWRVAWKWDIQLLGRICGGRDTPYSKGRECAYVSESEAFDCPIYREYDDMSGKFKIFAR